MAYNLIGKDFTPMDVEAKVTGRAKYAEDFRADNMVFCKMLTSSIPHAKIRSIDTSAALKMQGVLGILTADDVPEFPPPAPPILAKDEVHYIGEPILAIARGRTRCWCPPETTDDARVRRRAVRTESRRAAGQAIRLVDYRSSSPPRRRIRPPRTA